MPNTTPTIAERRARLDDIRGRLAFLLRFPAPASNPTAPGFQPMRFGATLDDPGAIRVDCGFRTYEIECPAEICHTVLDALVAAPILIEEIERLNSERAQLRKALKWLEYAVRDSGVDWENRDQLSQAMPAAHAALDETED